MATITVLEEQVDAIVIDELQDAIRMQLNLDKDEGGEYLEPDYRLIDAAKVLLEYYMLRWEYEEFIQELALQELAVQAQLDGQYDD